MTAHDPTPLLAEAAAAWSLPALRDVSIVTSSRMRTSLGLFDPRRRQIRLAAFLEAATPTLYREVVLHELAHSAVHLAHGRGPRPHGREWRAYMDAVGLRPRVRLPRQDVEHLLPARTRRPRTGWRHHCPKCRASRVAGRPVRRWRCGTCLAAGRDGKLEITRVTG
jgi:predicted SprT family Zn-dependent metalloprotease